MSENKNLLLAVSLSLIVILGWEIFIAKPRREELSQHKEVAKEQHKLKEIEIIENVDTKTLSYEEAISQSPRVKIISDRISGSINLTGARFDDIILDNYQVSKGSKERLHLLSPNKTKKSYFAEFGWLGDNSFLLPNKESQWHTDKNVLASGGSVTLSWDNYQGQVFMKKISLDKNYLFTVEDTIENYGQNPINIKHYGIINRSYDIKKENFFILHEGPIANIDGTLEEVTYKKLLKEKNVEFQSVTGWLGVSDKYWITAIVPEKTDSVDISFKSYISNMNQKFQASYKGQEQTIGAGKSYSTTNLIYSGAKELDVLDQYANQYHIPLFDRTIDFGILYFLTKPIFIALKFIYNFIGNFGYAIIILTFIMRIFLFPLASKSFKEISKMKKLTPEIAELKKKFKDDRMGLNKEMMSLYKKHQVKPMAGCLPLMVQIPVFFALYKVLFVTIEMRHTEFVGWIHDLSAPDPTSLANLFGLLPWGGFIPIGIWPCLMAITMIVQQKLNPTPSDPMQAKMMKFLPYFFAFLLASFPAGLVIYWTFNNLFSIIQQWFIMRGVEKEPVKVKK